LTVLDGCEVAVVGAGIVGTACARELAVRGVDVCLVDAGQVSGATTGLGEGNVLCSDVHPGPELELTLRGLALYDEIERRVGEPARIRRKGALIVHPDQSSWGPERERVARLAAAGVECRLVDPDEVRAMEPELTGELRGASFFPGDLQCAPRPIARALAAEAQREGARVRTGCSVQRIAVSDGSVAGLATAHGTIDAGAVVLAAGPWSANLAEDAGLPLPLEPRRGQLVRLERRPDFVRHKVVDGAYLASLSSPAAALEVTTVLETTWDGHVLVGSSRERRGFDLGVDPELSAAMVERAARLMPGLRALATDGAWAGLRPWLPDGLPAIGPSNTVPGLWVATGHEGAGVALGPVTGRLIAQALCGDEADVDLAPFAPDRFG
jgi:D-hydroxyproline dehydrogenase subunit beta